MDFRTDLAVEQREMTAKHSDNVAVRQYARQNANVTEIEILNNAGAQELGKPKGKYITMEIPAFSHDSELLDGRLTAMTESIRTLLPDEDGPVLVAGLGNEDVTPDALGPRTAHGIFATRHIDRALASELGFGELRDVCAITFGVLGQTGMETAETIRGIVNTIHPAAVITVDALAARSLQRLGKTVQLTERRGGPVIAIGFPTVVDAVTLVRDFTSEHKMAKEKEDEAKSMMVCPREIDVTIRRAARFLALSLNCALQPSISPDILLTIV